SIIDPLGGWQPLYNEDKNIVLIANGEIYNYIEIRQMLKDKGHNFRTKSDCEVIPHLYEEYGIDCVKHLRGMFALALWDVLNKRLLLARDRMGEKPLYVYEDKDFLLFSSELRSIMSSGLIKPLLSPNSTHLYFHYQYIPEPMTAVEGVYRLLAANILLLDTNEWSITKNCYWRMEDVEPIKGEPGDEIKRQLEEISSIVIRSDVPIGVALSGGLDSSIVAAISAKKYPGTIHAFSVGYPGHPPYDEREEAKALADHLKMPFFDVELTVNDMTDFFPELVLCRDEPIADISGYGYYAVMKLAKEHDVPVMLQGHGGDELFWGYSWLSRAVSESIKKIDPDYKRAHLLLDASVNLFPSLSSLRSVARWAIRLGFGIPDFLHNISLHTKADELIFYNLTPFDAKM
ncbi:MAG: asparagine synthase (glutamine-hydrolyzing), partial [Nitrospirae bacterium]